MITHQGEKNDAFQMCRDNTMNLRGSGDEIPGEEEGGKYEHGHGHRGKKRELVEKIEME